MKWNIIRIKQNNTETGLWLKFLWVYKLKAVLNLFLFFSDCIIHIP